jgi:hypothetical protein
MLAGGSICSAKRHYSERPRREFTLLLRPALPKKLTILFQLQFALNGTQNRSSPSKNTVREKYQDWLAEEGGFEPPRPFRV